MNETTLLSKLLPSHPDLFPIIHEIREKYNLPEIGLEEDGFTEFLLLDEELDWDQIKTEISSKVREIPILPEFWINLHRHYENRTADTFLVDGLDCLPDKSRKEVEYALQYIFNSYLPMLEKISGVYDEITNLILDHLITGRNMEVSYDWFGGVNIDHIDKEPIVIAIAGQFSNPKEIVKKFRHDYTMTFGKDRPKITKGHLNTAEWLAMKRTGKSIKDIADIYILRNPSQFPKDTQSKAYAEAKRKLEERLKKSMQRLEKVIDDLIGDKN